MFEYFEPDASGASNLPPSSPSTPQVRPERVRHMLYGSLAGIDRTIKILHARGYTNPNDWSDPIPVPPTSGTPGPTSPASTMPTSSEVAMWMAIATKTVLIE